MRWTSGGIFDEGAAIALDLNRRRAISRLLVSTAHAPFQVVERAILAKSP
jgi:hypothetical protein